MNLSLSTTLVLFGFLTSAAYGSLVKTGKSATTGSGLQPVFPADFDQKRSIADSYVEEELKHLVGDDERDSLEAPSPPATEHFVVTAVPPSASSYDDGGDDEDQLTASAGRMMNHPSATEFALASTGTPQLLVVNNNSFNNKNDNNDLLTTTAREVIEENVAEAEEDHWEELMSTLTPVEDDAGSSVAPSITSINADSSTAETSLKDQEGQVGSESAIRSADDEDKVETDVAWTTWNFTANEDQSDPVDDDHLEELEGGLDRKSPMIKKLARSLMNKGDVRRKAKSSAEAYEDLMEIVIKVAEHPNDWQEIEQLLEKIEYEDATLKKAKARLRALAMQKQIKLRKGSVTSKASKSKLQVTQSPARSENDVLMTSKVKPPAGGHHQPSGVKNHLVAHAAKTKPRKFQSVQVPHQVLITSLTAKQQKHQQLRRLDDEDVVDHRNDEGDYYAVEQPVTVIGERSLVDPIEKDVVEESTNQRLREIQRQKARLSAMADKTDDMESQLKALSKMERRLNEHWRQKQKLVQKIKQKNQWKQVDQRTQPQPEW